MKKLVSLILAVMLSVFASVTTFAAQLDTPVDDQIELHYQYTTYATSTLSISSKTATCKSIVHGISGTVTRITITQELQKKNGSSWTSIYGNGNTTFSSSASFVKKYSGLSSGTYRVKTIAKVYSGSKYETVTTYSANVSC